MGAPAVYERDHAVDHDSAITLGALDAAPLVGREIMRDFVVDRRHAPQLVEVEDDDVGRRAFAQKAAIDKTRRLPRAINAQAFGEAMATDVTPRQLEIMH